MSERDMQPATEHSLAICFSPFDPNLVFEQNIEYPTKIRDPDARLVQNIAGNCNV